MGNRPSAPSESQQEALNSRHQELCARAAVAISKADVLLLATGAGWSADSGLAIYRDVANVAAYHERNLTYRDICQPEWLTKDPALFFGFWGGCFNDYRDTPNHDGYGIIKRWVDQAFERGRAAVELRAYQEHEQQRAAKEKRAREAAAALRSSVSDEEAEERASGGEADETSAVAAASATSTTATAAADAAAPLAGAHDLAGAPGGSAVPGAFFAFTSNVDGHSRRTWGEHEVYEIHGHSESWQCADHGCASDLADECKDECKGGRWKAPDGFRFAVDPTSRLAADGAPVRTRIRHRGAPAIETPRSKCLPCTPRSKCLPCTPRVPRVPAVLRLECLACVRLRPCAPAELPSRRHAIRPPCRPAAPL